MPSLPTSLIIVGLVVAWLVVLVPMVAKRREQVPENFDESANFRVLQRNSTSRRRPVFSRTAMAHRSRGDIGGDDDANEYDAAAGDASGAGPVDGSAGEQDFADDGSDIRGTADDGPVDQRVDVVAVSADAPRMDARPENDGFLAERGMGRASAEPPAAEYRRTPIRQGRGGFDPAAADRTQAYRFRRRQRVVLLLATIALAGAAVGYVGSGYGYAAAVVGIVLLALYLAYLRRQVRIENEIRRRREARLTRSRQIRPGYRPSVAEQVYAHRTGEIPRPGQVEDYRVTSHVRQTVPPSSYGYGEPVDFEDSDPAFDDLEYYRPAAYRRRAG
jgi:hypothetical protein